MNRKIGVRGNGKLRTQKVIVAHRVDKVRGTRDRKEKDSESTRAHTVQGT